MISAFSGPRELELGGSGSRFEHKVVSAGRLYESVESSWRAVFEGFFRCWCISLLLGTAFDFHGALDLKLRMPARSQLTQGTRIHLDRRGCDVQKMVAGVRWQAGGLGL